MKTMKAKAKTLDEVMDAKPFSAPLVTTVHPKLTYVARVEWSEEDRAFIAKCDKLPGCLADGRTRESALGNLEGIIKHWLETAVLERTKIVDENAVNGTMVVNGTKYNLPGQVIVHIQQLRYVLGKTKEYVEKTKVMADSADRVIKTMTPGI